MVAYNIGLAFVTVEYTTASFHECYHVSICGSTCFKINVR